MRALRDFNTPKIVTDDTPIFMGLIGDLFPALNVPRKRDMDFEAMVKTSVIVRKCMNRQLSVIHMYSTYVHRFKITCHSIMLNVDVLM